MHIDNSASGRCATASALFTPYILQGYNPRTQSTLHHGATTTIFSSYLYLKIIHRRDRSLNVNTPSNSYFMYIYTIYIYFFLFIYHLWAFYIPKKYICGRSRHTYTNMNNIFAPHNKANKYKQKPSQTWHKHKAMWANTHTHTHFICERSLTSRDQE